MKTHLTHSEVHLKMTQQEQETFFNYILGNAALLLVTSLLPFNLKPLAPHCYMK